MTKITRLAMFMLLMLSGHVLLASFEVLNKPAVKTTLAEKSVLIDLINYNDQILTVGERGHILTWQSPGEWQQQEVPVSVLLTAVTILSDGTKVAVGHDSAILVSAPGSNKWQKVFDGYQLLDLKMALFEKQIEAINAEIAASDDEELIEELEFKLEEYTFGIDDTQVEKDEGPNKPLLSIAATQDDRLFAVGAYGTLLYSNDKGQSWVLQDDSLDNPDKFHLNSVITTDDDRLYIVGENATAFVSLDKGVSWERMNMPYAGTMFGISAQANSANLVAYGLQGNLMVSNDAGKNWSLNRIDTSGSFQGGTISDSGRAYVVGHGGMIVDFDVNTPDEVNIIKHPSGAAFAKPMIQNDALILVGQFGIISWPLKNNKE